MISLSATYQIAAPRERVYAALQDPEVLRRCIEGCQRLTQTEPGVYDADLKLGLGAIKGQFTGRASVRDPNPPDSFTLVIDGKGPGGVVRGEAKLQFAEVNGTTSLACNATGNVAGALAAVGSRLIQSAASRMMEKFFTTLSTVMAGR